jgi:hypothetical protein
MSEQEEQEEEQEEEELGEALSDYDLDKMYQDYLDETFGDVVIAGISYSCSYAFKEIDPIAYNCGFADWISQEAEDGGSLKEVDGTYYKVD